MPPPPHPVLEPYLTASHLSAVVSYDAGPGVRTKAPSSLSGLKKAKKTRAACISRLRRAAYMEMLERACEQAYNEEDQIAARLEAEREERFVLLHNIRALEKEMSKRTAANRRDIGEFEVLAADYGTGEVISAQFRVAKVAAAEEAGKRARQRRGRTDSAPRAEIVDAYFDVAEVESSGGAEVIDSDILAAEVAAAENGGERARGWNGRTDSAPKDAMDAAGFEVAKVAHSKRPERVSADFWAAEEVAFDFEAVDVVAAYFGVAEVFAAEEAEKHARERSEMAALGSRFAPQLWEDVDLDFGDLMRGMQCTANA